MSSTHRAAWTAALAAVEATASTSPDHAAAKIERVRALIATAPSRAAEGRAYAVLERIQSAQEFLQVMAATNDGADLVSSLEAR